MRERPAVLESHGHPAGKRVRIAGREARVRPHADLVEKALHIRLGDAFRAELRGLNVAVEQRHGQQVGEAVIGVLLRVDVGLRPEASAAREVVCGLDDVGVDARDFGRIERLEPVQFEHAEDRRLGRGGAVVALESQPIEAIQPHVLPVDVDWVVERLG